MGMNKENINKLIFWQLLYIVIYGFCTAIINNCFLIMKVMPEQLSDRAFFLSHDKLDVWQWSEKVYSFVHDMAESNVN